MQRYLGVDVHGESCTFSVLSEAGREVQRQVVETNGQALVGYLRQLPGTLHLCLEEGEWSQWLYEDGWSEPTGITRPSSGRVRRRSSPPTFVELDKDMRSMEESRTGARRGRSCPPYCAAVHTGSTSTATSQTSHLMSTSIAMTSRASSGSCRSRSPGTSDFARMSFAVFSG